MANCDSLPNNNLAIFENEHGQADDPHDYMDEEMMQEVDCEACMQDTYQQ